MALGIAEGICEVFGGSLGNAVKETIKIMPAKNFSNEFARTYKSTVADLKLRAGANTKYSVIDSVPQNQSVRCYGYYTKEPDGTIWLYVVYNGQEGFISKKYLI